MGLFSIRLNYSDLLEVVIQSFLAHKGLALLDVKTSADELIMRLEIQIS